MINNLTSQEDLERYLLNNIYLIPFIFQKTSKVLNARVQELFQESEQNVRVKIDVFFERVLPTYFNTELKLEHLLGFDSFQSISSRSFLQADQKDTEDIIQDFQFEEKNVLKVSEQANILKKFSTKMVESYLAIFNQTRLRMGYEDLQLDKLNEAQVTSIQDFQIISNRGYQLLADPRRGQKRFQMGLDSETGTQYQKFFDFKLEDKQYAEVDWESQKISDKYPYLKKDIENAKIIEILNKLRRQNNNLILDTKELQVADQIDQLLIFFETIVEFIQTSYRYNHQVQSHSHMLLAQQLHIQKLFNLEETPAQYNEAFQRLAIFLQEELREEENMLAYQLNFKQDQPDTLQQLDDDFKLKVNKIIFDQESDFSEEMLTCENVFKFLIQKANCNFQKLNSSVIKNFSLDAIKLSKIQSVLEEPAVFKVDQEQQTKFEFLQAFGLNNTILAQKQLDILSAKNLSFSKLLRIIQGVKDLIQLFYLGFGQIPLLFIYLFGNIPYVFQDDKEGLRLYYSQSFWLKARSYQTLLQLLAKAEQSSNFSLFKVQRGRDYQLSFQQSVVKQRTYLTDDFKANFQDLQLEKFMNSQRNQASAFLDISLPLGVKKALDQIKYQKPLLDYWKEQDIDVLNIQITVDNTFQAFRETVFDIQNGVALFQEQLLEGFAFHQELEEIKQKHAERVAEIGDQRGWQEQFQEIQTEKFAEINQHFKDFIIPLTAEFKTSPFQKLLSRVIIDFTEIFRQNFGADDYIANESSTQIQFILKIPIVTTAKELQYGFRSVKISLPTQELLVIQSRQVSVFEQKQFENMLNKIAIQVFSLFITNYLESEAKYDMNEEDPDLRSKVDVDKVHGDILYYLYMQAKVTTIKVSNLIVRVKIPEKDSLRLKKLYRNTVLPKAFQDDYHPQQVEKILKKEQTLKRTRTEFLADEQQDIPEALKEKVKQKQQSGKRKYITPKEELLELVQQNPDNLELIFRILKIYKIFMFLLNLNARKALLELPEHYINYIELIQDILRNPKILKNEEHVLNQAGAKTILQNLQSLYQQRINLNQQPEYDQKTKQVMQQMLKQIEKFRDESPDYMVFEEILNTMQGFAERNLERIERDQIQLQEAEAEEQKDEDNTGQMAEREQIVDEELIAEQNKKKKTKKKQKIEQKKRGEGLGRYQLETVLERKLHLPVFLKFIEVNADLNLRCLQYVNLFIFNNYFHDQMKEVSVQDFQLLIETIYPHLSNCARQGQVWDWCDEILKISNFKNISFRFWCAQNQTLFYEKYYKKEAEIQLLMVISDYHIFIGQLKEVQNFARKTWAGKQLLQNPSLRFKSHNFKKEGKETVYKFPTMVEAYDQKNLEGILFFDFETTSEQEQKLETFCVCIIGSIRGDTIKKYFVHPDCESQLVIYLLDLSKQYYQKFGNKFGYVDIVGWNNARFDNYFLLNALLRILGPCNTRILGSFSNSKAVFFDIYRVKDLCLTIQSSLRRACVQFKIPQNEAKQDFDILKYPTLQDLRNNQEIILDYCFQDCVAVEKVLKSFQEQIQILKDKIIDELELKQVSKEKIFLGNAVPLSISSFANKFLAFFKEDYGGMEFQGIENSIIYEKCRSSYFGGLTYVFNYSLAEETYFMDVSSLYPSILEEEELPCNYLKTQSYAVGVAADQNWVQERLIKTNLYRVKRYRYKEKSFPRIPKKINGVNIFLREQKECSVYMWGVELQAEDFEILVIDEELVFETTKEKGLFQKLVLYLYKLKQEAQRTGQRVLRNMIKLLLNSLYGYFGKKDYDQQQFFASPEWDQFLELHLQNNHYETVSQLLKRDSKKWSKKEFIQKHYQENFSIQDWNIEGAEIKEVGDFKYLCLTKKAIYDKMQAGACVYLASYITAKARARMVYLIKLAGGIKNLKYMDTDSMVMNRVAFDLLKQHGQIDEKLGYLMNEISGQPDDAICHNFQAFAKKIYIAQNPDGSIQKAAFKGLQKDGRKITKDESTGISVEDKFFTMEYYNFLRENSQKPFKANIAQRASLQKKQGHFKHVIQQISLDLKTSLKVNAKGQTRFFKDESEYLEYYQKNLVYKFECEIKGLNNKIKMKTSEFKYI